MPPTIQPITPQEYMQALVQAFGSKLFSAEPWFQVVNATIGAGIATQLNGVDLNIRLNYDIFVTALGITSTGIFDFQFQDVSGGVLYSNAPVRSSSLIGTANPYYLFYRPWTIPAKSDISLNLVNQIAGANTVQLVLIAFKGEPQAGDQLGPNA